MEGSRYLGGFVGTTFSLEEWLTPKIRQWTSAVETLAKYAGKYPQTAFAGLTKSLQQEWQYVQRVTPGVGAFFQPVEDAIVEKFLPALFGLTASAVRDFRPLLTLPAREGGLGIPNPTESADLSFTSSSNIVEELADALRNNDTSFDVGDFLQDVRRRRQNWKGERLSRHSRLRSELLLHMDPPSARRLARSRVTGAWLTTMPSALNGTDLTSEEFRDSLLLRFGLTPTGLTSRCACGEPFSVDHALSCKRGGLIGQQHDGYSDEWQTLCGAALKPSCVHNRPRISTGRVTAMAEGALPTVGPNLEGDSDCFNFWAADRTAVFDVRVVHLDAPSYLPRTNESVLLSHEHEKKKKYVLPCAEINRSFTPLVVSSDGMQAVEHDKATKRLASHLSIKWKRRYSTCVNFVRARLAFAMVRAVSRNLRASRSPTPYTPAIGWESGDGLCLYR